MSEARIGGSARRARRPRSDGEQSRTAILHEAGQLATVEGIDGLSLSRLAEAVGMSKSGIFAHFGSKEELQLATIEAATAVFVEDVIEPALAGKTGIERVRQLADNFLRYVQDNVYPGGCFFASVAAELDTHPGPVRDRALQMTDEWLSQLERAVRDAQSEGAIDRSEDPEQLAFELNAYLLLANAQFVAHRKSTSIERAGTALERRLDAASPTA
jgi:AcrR family transcriptional regulator